MRRQCKEINVVFTWNLSEDLLKNNSSIALNHPPVHLYEARNTVRGFWYMLS